jgi:hypothetical protein
MYTCTGTQPSRRWICRAPPNPYAPAPRIRAELARIAEGIRKAPPHGGKLRRLTVCVGVGYSLSEIEF